MNKIKEIKKNVVEFVKENKEAIILVGCEIGLFVGGILVGKVSESNKYARKLKAIESQQQSDAIEAIRFVVLTPLEFNQIVKESGVEIKTF